MELLLEILDEQITQLKDNIKIEQEEVFKHQQSIRTGTSKFIDFKEYLEQYINYRYSSRGIADSKKLWKLYHKKSIPISISYEHITDLRNSKNSIKNLSEDSVEKIQRKISVIIKTIVEINDINEILEDDIRGYYEYIEMMTDIYLEKMRLP